MKYTGHSRKWLITLWQWRDVLEFVEQRLKRDWKWRNRLTIVEHTLKHYWKWTSLLEVVKEMIDGNSEMKECIGTCWTNIEAWLKMNECIGTYWTRIGKYILDEELPYNLVKYDWTKLKRWTLLEIIEQWLFEHEGKCRTILKHNWTLSKKRTNVFKLLNIDWKTKGVLEIVEQMKYYRKWWNVWDIVEKWLEMK